MLIGLIVSIVANVLLFGLVLRLHGERAVARDEAERWAWCYEEATVRDVRPILRFPWRDEAERSKV